MLPSSLSLLFLPILLLSILLSPTSSQFPPPKGTLIDCGATTETRIGGRTWLPDAGFVTAGVSKNVMVPVLMFPFLSTVRSFPLDKTKIGRKFCYTVPVFRGARYMVRSTYFYGGVNGVDYPEPPVFDQIIDGTTWAVVNTTADYADGNTSYVEAVLLAQGKTMSVCVAGNTYTESDPFISALEFIILDGSVYNSTDFNQYGLALVARHSFGHNGPMIRYPDDQFDRIWQPFGPNDPTISRNRNVSVSGIWNLPPTKIFEAELATVPSDPIHLPWPPGPLELTMYYIALYFADDGTSSSTAGNSRVLNVSINGTPYYKDLSLTPEGSVVFCSRWQLNGSTTVTLTPTTGSTSGPLINAGEVFKLMPIGGRTLTRDVIALEQIKERLQNPPVDWSGDPCMPRENTWTGITCSEGPRIRVVTLNLTGMGLSGSLSPSIARMTGLTDIWLGNNNLTGSIPDPSSLRMLETLHLDDNRFSGPIPSSLGNIKNLRELFLQNNNLTGTIPSSLVGKPGLDLKTYGNPISSPPPS